MNLVRVLDKAADYFRPELLVRPEIVARENEFMEHDDGRLAWVLNHVYLTPGGLEDLKKHPDYKPIGESFRFAYFASNPNEKRCRHKKVSFEVIVGNDTEDSWRVLIESFLKNNLHNRGCNAGVHYRTYRQGSLLIAEAVPARLDCE